VNKPTDEQAKESWERYGLKESPSGIRYPEDRGSDYHRTYPPIDLNNLFRYAEFKAVINIGIKRKISIDDARGWLFELWLDNMKKGLNYIDALFWALWEVKDNDNASSHP